MGEDTRAKRRAAVRAARSRRRQARGADRESVSPPAPRRGPALAMVELSSIARGMVVADAMVKRAAVRLLRAEALTPGKFVVLIGGGEEEVGQSLEVGIELASATLIDRLYLPKADTQLAPAIDGETQLEAIVAVGIVETFSVAAAILAADRAVKAADVRLVRLRLARGLGGKAFFVLSGDLHQLEAGIEAARSIIHDGMLQHTEIIARPHPDFVRTL